MGDLLQWFELPLSSLWSGHQVFLRGEAPVLFGVRPRPADLMITRVRLVHLVCIRLRPYLRAAPARSRHLASMGNVFLCPVVRCSCHVACLLPLRHSSHSWSINLMLLVFQGGKKLIDLNQGIASVAEGALSFPLFDFNPIWFRNAVDLARVWQT